MFAVFRPIFEVDTKIIFDYNFRDPLILLYTYLGLENFSGSQNVFFLWSGTAIPSKTLLKAYMGYIWSAQHPKAYSESGQTSKMEYFAKIGNIFS